MATISLDGNRVLRGRINHDDAVILHNLLNKYPRLDTYFTRALSSPREAMRTFVDAVMDNDLMFASKFLDFSEFDEESARHLAEPCARKLKDVIDSVWYIDFDEIPDDPDSESPYILASGSDQEPDEDLLPVVQAIRISRDTSSGHWPFTSETVAMVVNEFLDASKVRGTSE